MWETLYDHHTSISTGGRPISNLRFSDDINLLSGSKNVDRATACGMEVSTEKSKIMTNSTNNIRAVISMNGQKLEEVTSFQ